MNIAKDPGFQVENVFWLLEFGQRKQNPDDLYANSNKQKEMLETIPIMFRVKWNKKMELKKS